MQGDSQVVTNPDELSIAGNSEDAAAALDALADAGSRVDQAEKEAEAARKKAEEAENRLSRAMEAVRPGIDREEMTKIEAAVETAREAVREAHKAERKVAKARAGEILSQRHAEAVGAIGFRILDCGLRI